MVDCIEFTVDIVVALVIELVATLLPAEAVETQHPFMHGFPFQLGLAPVHT